MFNFIKNFFLVYSKHNNFNKTQLKLTQNFNELDINIFNYSKSFFNENVNYPKHLIKKRDLILKQNLFKLKPMLLHSNKNKLNVSKFKQHFLNTLKGQEYYSDCHVSTNNERLIPCILNPYPLYHLMQKFPHENPFNFKNVYQNQFKKDHKFHSSNFSPKIMKLFYNSGEYGYFPCRTLGAGTSEVSIIFKLNVYT